MKHLYSFHPNLILRTTAQAFSTDFDENTILTALNDKQFAEALYLASPGLYEECCKWQAGTLHDPKKVARLCATLTRYYTRMRSRCTPFGLFAGCSVIRWGAQNHVQLVSARNTRHTRLDMHYLCALAQHLAQKATIRPLLRYWPQTSLYQLGTELRYVEYYYVDGQRVHQISSVEVTSPLLKILAAARSGLTYEALLELLIAEESVDMEEASFFVQTLIDSQLLVSELEPTVTGPEYLLHLQKVLACMHAAVPSDEISAALDLLTAVAKQLQILDQETVNTSQSYQRIAAALRALEVPIEPDKLFQTDLICGVDEVASTLDHTLQDTLLEAVKALTYLSRSTRNHRLEHFKQRFQQRYEEQEVPLLEALDTESGLSYSDYGKHSYSPLVYDLYLTETATDVLQQQDEVQRFLARKLREAEQQHHYTVDLTPDEVQSFTPIADPLPPSLSILFRVVGEQLVLDSVGGSSAVNLLGRFAHADPALETIVRDITAHEQRQNSTVVFAEICHLPVSRIGNILLRPSFRDFEIPYLAQSTQPYENQIAVQDLLVSVRQGQLILRSRETGHRIVPRLSTAHNFSHQALPVYEFLCDLQTQGLQAHLGVRWETATLETKFFPRLTYQQVVLQGATWHLAASDLQTLLTAPLAEQEVHFRAFQAQWQLPRFFTLADGDHELLVDAENPLLRQVWLDTIRQRPSIKLKEFLFDPATSPVRDEQHRPHVQQLLALLVRNMPCYPAVNLTPAALADEDVPRNFALGSEWLYYKWYCGPQMANRILREVLRPLTQELQERQLIDKWFFIRYADPDNHLRVRFHLPVVERLGETVQLISNYLAPCLGASYIWKSQTDTYCRELERYGPRTIVLSESLFHYQSIALLRDLEQFTGDDDTAYWQWGLYAIDELLEAFTVPLEQKLTLLQELRESFAQEFSMDKPLKSQLDAKYRLYRSVIAQTLTPTVLAPASLQQLATAIRQQLSENGDGLSQARLLGSYIHMLLNRLIPAQARLHELVLYDFLSRYYQSCQVRQSQQVTVP
ncbi:lantibiotic dehydratase [Hymenobacter crusticola]|uniref:Lantibiotic dehydratase n=1 Tax=Hymenobacter crusticola TaxID=1770526 RepID=A0A243W847_9BACT|nr:lantibiotic dehydratase [Hymenobacter crusticola]OUJ71070.1 hypothetical protein BXP70_23190 [Hymenobacter crusticola]